MLQSVRVCLRVYGLRDSFFPRAYQLFIARNLVLGNSLAVLLDQVLDVAYGLAFRQFLAILLLVHSPPL